MQCLYTRFPFSARDRDGERWLVMYVRPTYCRNAPLWEACVSPQSVHTDPPSNCPYPIRANLTAYLHIPQGWQTS